MAEVTGITLVKKFTYRGDALEEFSNQYFLTQAPPSTPATWHSLVDALVVEEKKVFPSTVIYQRAYAYNSDAPDATTVDVYDLGGSITGTCTVGTNDRQMPGDVAVVGAWKTSRLSSTGKAIWLRKYFHGALQENTNPDFVTNEQYAAVGAFCTKLRDGSFISGRTIRSRTNDETIVSSKCIGYLTTRTLKRRGRRPSP